MSTKLIDTEVNNCFIIHRESTNKNKNLHSKMTIAGTGSHFFLVSRYFLVLVNAAVYLYLRSGVYDTLCDAYQNRRTSNRLFPSSCLPPLQSESKCKVFVMIISSSLPIFVHFCSMISTIHSLSINDTLGNKVAAILTKLSFYPGLYSRYWASYLV